MAKKDDTRYKIDSLIKIASITSDRILREECCMEAKNLIDDINESIDCITLFLTRYCDVGTNFRTSRSDIFEYYNFIREKEDLPYLTIKHFYARLREYGVPEGKSQGIWYFGIRKRVDPVAQEVTP